MNRVASRAFIAVLLALLLVAGLGFFVVEYVTNAADWVMFPGSPHVYSGGNIGCGTVVDREGTMLLDLENGRMLPPKPFARLPSTGWATDMAVSVRQRCLPTLQSWRAMTF